MFSQALKISLGLMILAMGLRAAEPPKPTRHYVLLTPWVSYEGDKDYSGSCKTNRHCGELTYAIDVLDGKIVNHFLADPPYLSANRSIKLTPEEAAKTELITDGTGTYWIKKFEMNSRMLVFAMNTACTMWVFPPHGVQIYDKQLLSFAFDTDGLGVDKQKAFSNCTSWKGVYKDKDKTKMQAMFHLNESKYIDYGEIK